MRRLIQFIAIVCVVCFAVLIITTRLPTEKFQRLSCEDIVSGCGNQEFHLRFVHTPEVMQPMQLVVQVPNAKQVFVSFAMDNMEMGLNRYQLFKQAGKDLWGAEVILPVCVQGGSEWIVQLEIKRHAQTIYYQLPFRTDSQN